MTREERDLSGVTVPGSDHLTAYNLYAEAFSRCGYIGEVYGLSRHLFDESIQRWAEQRGVLVKSIEDAALATASIFRSLGMELPDRMVNARDHIYRKFTKLLAQFMPFDLVIDEQTADGTEARVSKTSVCGSWGPIAGDLRYFADRSGIPRAAIEGTQIPPELIRANATRGKAEIVYDPRRKHGPLALRRKVEYFGFELEREVDSLDEFPPELATEARHVLADSLARGEARHFAVRKNQSAIDEIREASKRSGGQTGKLGLAELTALYEEQLASVNTMEGFKAARLTVDRQRFVPGDSARELAELPSGHASRPRCRAGLRRRGCRWYAERSGATAAAGENRPHPDGGRGSEARSAGEVRRAARAARSRARRYSRGPPGKASPAMVARRGRWCPR